MGTEQGPATLVDSNVLLDLFTVDPEWSAWSRARLAEALDRGPVVVNQVVYGEVAYRFSTIEALDEVLTPDRFVRLTSSSAPMPPFWGCSCSPGMPPAIAPTSPQSTSSLLADRGISPGLPEWLCLTCGMALVIDVLAQPMERLTRTRGPPAAFRRVAAGQGLAAWPAAEDLAGAVAVA